MPRTELHDLRNDDRDAAYEAVRASRSAWPRAAFADRARFDDWTRRDDVSAWVVGSDDDIVGVAAAMDVDGDREILLAVSPSADDDATTDALRLLTAREPERPLYACVAADDQPSHDVLARIGFVEHRRDGDDVVYVLPPTLE
ncbi:GNAT family N-acetyltransferase [Microbacterium sp. NPDC090007]|uniref:GNAT family N-acetyltransferase n=1 Tax=Microbacterium sp. NPDC090007 TaxID=3364204 RepID=UPI0038055640